MLGRTGLIGSLTMLALLVACDDATGPGGAPAGSGVSLSFAAVVPGGPQLRLASYGNGAVTADGSLELASVQIVLREIEVKRVDVADCDVEPEPEGCDEFETGPVLVDLPLGGGTAHQVTVDLEPGEYDEVEFDLHKVSKDDPEDAAFRDAHPDFIDTSIRVTGKYDGQPFTYETDLDVEQEFDLATPLVVDGVTTSTNLTIRTDLSLWFVDAAGVSVNPADANKGGPHESIVKENIKQSFEAFEDEDRDGDDDTDVS